MIGALADLAVVKTEDSLNQLTRLEGVLFDQSESFVEGMLRLDLGLESLTEGVYPRHNISEIMGQSHGQNG